MSELDKKSSVGSVILAVMPERLLKTAGVLSAVRGMGPEARNAVTEIGGLGVLAVPGLDTLQSKVRARMAGDKTTEGAEKRRFLGEGAHAALDVGGLGILAGPEFKHLKHASQLPPVLQLLCNMTLRKAAGVGVGSGMSTSQYSGRLSDGAFKMTSGIPAFKRPELSSPEEGENKQAASMNTATDAMSPAGKLNVTQRIGAPKTTGFAGPSIADVSKPKGFGAPISGAKQNRL